MTRQWFLPLALVSCTFDAGPMASSGTSGGSNSCVPGQAECICFEDFSCLPGLMCFYGKCVVPNEGSSTSSGSTSVGSTSQNDTDSASSSESSEATGNGSASSGTGESTNSTGSEENGEGGSVGSTGGSSTSGSSTTDETSDSSESSANDESEGGDCTPFSRECINLTQYHVCNAEGKWGPPLSCVKQACRDGECAGECSPGKKRCQDNEVQICTDAGIWKTHTVCDSPEEVCEQGQCIEACVPWVWQAGTHAKDESIGIALDSSDAPYITGFTEGTFDGQSAAGGKDVFLAKLNSSGKKIWIQQLGTSFDDEGLEIATDNWGNAYVTGYTDGVLGGSSPTSNRDLYLAKFDSNGGKQWLEQIGSESSEIPLPVDSSHALGVDGSGNAYISGRTNGVFAGQKSAGDYDFFVMNFDASGKMSWTQQMGTSGEDHGIGVALSRSGNSVYVTGYTNGGLHGNPHAGDKDIFLSKFSSGGSREWTQQLGNQTWNEGYAVALDPLGNAYVTGATGGQLGSNGAAGLGDFFVAKYSPSGMNVWTKQFGTADMESGLGIAVDASGNSYITGPTNGTFEGNSLLGSDDIFVAKVDANGNLKWVKQFGTSGRDWGIAIALDRAGHPYVTGYVSGALGGQPWAGDRDLFVAGICSDGQMLLE